MEDRWERLPVRRIPGEEVERRHEQLSGVFWSFICGFILQFNSTNAGCFECCIGQWIWEAIGAVPAARVAVADEEVAVSELVTARSSGICRVDVGDCEFGICGDGRQRAYG